MYSPTKSLEAPKDFGFPYNPYTIQQEMMKAVYETIEKKSIGIFESPTGTGKSLTLTCATLKWLFDHERLVRSEIEEKVASLDLCNVESDNSMGEDWINTQSIVIEQQKELSHLLQLQKRIWENDKVLENITNSREFSIKRKKLECIDGVRSDSDFVDMKEPVSHNFHDVKIFFCSRTHSQLAQVVREVKNTVYGKKVRCITLASRQHLCTHSETKRLANVSLINERCLEMIRNEKKAKSQEKKMCTCPLRAGEKVEDFAKVLLSEISDIEEMVNKSQPKKVCPYYATRCASKFAQLVMLPYQMLFHRRTREQSGIDLKGSVVIIDEAHNLLDSIININSSVVRLEDLKLAEDQIFNYKKQYINMISAKNLLLLNQLLFIIKQLLKILARPPENKLLRTFELAEYGQFFNIDLNKVINFCEETQLAKKLRGFLDCRVRGRDLLSAKNEISEEPVKKTNNIGSKVSLGSIVAFLESLTDKADDGRVFINVDKQNSYLKYMLLNPAGYFNDILKESRAIIIAGGTMQPTFELTEQLLSSCRERVTQNFYDHVVSPDSILPFAVSFGPSLNKLNFTYTNRKSVKLLDDLGTIFDTLCSIIPAGIVCFFSSYEYLELVYDHLEKNGIIAKMSCKKIVMRESNVSDQPVEKLLKEYSRAVREQGAFLMSVVGGNLSEGLNFADDLGRAVIVVGLPYPNRSSPELHERMNYLDETLGCGAGNEFYENICIKAVNQCIGRSVRHINDYASVFLLDERYALKRIQQKLPKWISQNIRASLDFEIIKNMTLDFFKMRI